MGSAGPYRTPSPPTSLVVAAPSLASRLRAWWWRRRHWVRVQPCVSGTTPTVRLLIRCGGYRTAFVLAGELAGHVAWARALPEDRDVPVRLTTGIELLPAAIVPELKRVVALLGGAA